MSNHPEFAPARDGGEGDGDNMMENSLR